MQCAANPPAGGRTARRRRDRGGMLGIPAHPMIVIFVAVCRNSNVPVVMGGSDSRGQDLSKHGLSGRANTAMFKLSH